MREIKFRAWVNGGEDHNFDHIMTEIIYPPINEPLNQFIESIQRWGVLMQYTGLKDKNGKEIYEGDIIRHSRNRVRAVQYYESNWCYDLGCSDFVLDQEVSCDPEKDCEVIGNIYEHPHLLEDASDHLK